MNSTLIANPPIQPRAGELPGPSLAAIKTLSDEDLLRHCARGHAAALEELVRRYQGPIYRFVLRLVDSREDAEETTLEVFVRAWRHAAQFAFRARVATWLYRIAGNLALDLRQRRKMQPQVRFSELPRPPEGTVANAQTDAVMALERDERARAVQAALGRMSDSDRLLLVLYYVEQREYDEMQAIAGVSRGALKTRLVRARRRLRDLLCKMDRCGALQTTDAVFPR